MKRGKGLKEIRELNNVVSKNGSLYSSINASNKQFINCFNTYNNHAEPVYNKYYQYHIRKIKETVKVVDG